MDTIEILLITYLAVSYGVVLLEILFNPYFTDGISEEDAMAIWLSGSWIAIWFVIPCHVEQYKEYKESKRLKERQRASQEEQEYKKLLKHRAEYPLEWVIDDYNVLLDGTKPRYRKTKRKTKKSSSTGLQKKK